MILFLKFTFLYSYFFLYNLLFTIHIAFCRFVVFIDYIVATKVKNITISNPFIFLYECLKSVMVDPLKG